MQVSLLTFSSICLICCVNSYVVLLVRAQGCYNSFKYQAILENSNLSQTSTRAAQSRILSFKNKTITNVILILLSYQHTKYKIYLQFKNNYTNIIIN